MRILVSSSIFLGTLMAYPIAYDKSREPKHSKLRKGLDIITNCFIGQESYFLKQKMALEKMHQKVAASYLALFCKDYFVPTQIQGQIFIAMQHFSLDGWTPSTKVTLNALSVMS